jgi:hypothetical protein
MPRHGRWLANLKAGAGIACLSVGYIRLKRGVEWQLGGENIRQTIREAHSPALSAAGRKAWRCHRHLGENLAWP